MRNKNRIANIMGLLTNAWKIKPDVCFYELLLEVYHDDEEQWTLYYKEDDYWENKIKESFNIDNISSNLSYNNMSELQKEIIDSFEIIWEKYFDLRFPQICNLIYNFVGKDISDENMLKTLKKKAGELLGNG